MVQIGVTVPSSQPFFVPLVTVLLAVSSPLRSMPGPCSAHFTRWWYLCRVLKRYSHRDTFELHKQLGMYTNPGRGHRIRSGPYFFQKSYCASCTERIPLL